MRATERRKGIVSLRLGLVGALLVGALSLHLVSGPLSPSLISDTQAKGVANGPVAERKDGITEVKSLGPVPLLLTIVLAGAFGGFVDGLRSESVYAISFGKKKLQIGSLGDLLVGATAAIAIFTVADAVFQIKLDFQTNAAKEFVKLVAWAVLSGYVGPRLLNPLSERLVRQLAVAAAREEVTKGLGVANDAEIHVRKGDTRVAGYDLQGGRASFATAGFNIENVKDLLDEAVASYELALELNPQDKQALLGKSRALRRQAEVAAFEKDDKRKDACWKQALSILAEIIGFDPNSPKAYYNRACYRVVSGISKQDAQSDLEEAFRLQPGLRAAAKKDADFDAVKTEKWFKDLVSS